MSHAERDSVTASLVFEKFDEYAGSRQQFEEVRGRAGSGVLKSGDEENSDA